MSQNLQNSLSPHLQKLKYEMELRGYSVQTQRHYLCHLNLLEQYYKRPATDILPDELKDYLHYRIKSGISHSYINISCSAFKLFFNKVLSLNWSGDVIVRPKRRKKLNQVLSQEEILSIFDHVSNFKNKTVLMTIYSSGLRISEALNLKVSDIDSKNMLIRVSRGKGNKDRLTVLSSKNLEQLRRYWKLYRPTEFLFPGLFADKPLAATNIQLAFRKAKNMAGISKPATVHTLRASFATHLLEAHTDLRTIQLLMGHSDVSMTANYIHLSTAHIASVRSPLDRCDRRA